MWGQYRLMMNSDPGYEYENVVYADVAGTPQGQREVAIERLRAMPEVEMVAVASEMPYHGQSGNNVSLPGDDRDLFNIADLYWVDESWLSMMEIPVIEGTAFRRGVTDPSGDSEMMVNRAFAERIVEMTGWTDGVVGKTLNVSEHPARTIIGVYENFRVGAINRLEERPTVMGYAEDYANFDMSYIMVRLRRVDGETMRAVQDVLTAAMPDKRVTVNAMKNTVAGLYNNERVERNSVVLCSIITLVIVLFGLVGYLRNEISRRSAEISIRKINGAGVSDVLRLLGREILYIAVPALTAGAIASYHVARRWISGFSEQIALSPWLFVGSAAAVLVVILAVTVGATWRIARRNPVESFKAE
jgi:putative ABC transport system permease protein